MASPLQTPSTARYDRLEKRQIYAEFKIPYLTRTKKYWKPLELQNGKWMLIATHANDDEIAIVPFNEVLFSLAALWPDE